MTKLKLFITRKIPSHLVEPFKNEVDISMWESETEPIPRDTLMEKAKDVDGIICLLTEKIDEEFLQKNQHLKVIANNAVGYDNIDVDTAKKFGIIVTNTPDVLTETTADLAFTLLVATARRVVEANEIIKNNQWGTWSPFTLAGTDIYGKRLGIVGMGRIGEAVARRAKGFNMDVVYHNRNRKEAAEKALDVQYMSFEQLVETSDYVLSLLPLTKETEKTFNENTFNKMKDSAIFINVSRGGVVDEQALYSALKNKTIRAAGLDVFTEEPISNDHPFVSLENALLLPHIGSATVETREAMLRLCLQNASAVLQGKEALTEIKD